MQPLRYEESKSSPFRRLHQGVQVFYRPIPMGKHEQEYLSELALEKGFGGMFLPGKQPMAPGTVLHMVFHAPGSGDSARPVRARGMVFERRRWRREPTGMGILFLDFDGLGDGPLAVVLDRLLTPGTEPL